MKKKTIVIAQENAMQAKQIAEALGDSDLFEVAGIATDGLSAVKTTEITAADICILDLTLQHDLRRNKRCSYIKLFQKT